MATGDAPGRQLNFPGLQAEHKPRRPEQTVLYEAVRSHFRTFEAMAELGDKRLPKHVSAEFEAFLKCGILAHGFLRLKCDDCKREKLVAFSCKKRGFCSSCGGRRMAESAAHLIDEVFPKVGVRQWVLSFPMPIRFILAKNPKIQGACLTIVHRAITAYIRKKAKQKGFRSKLQPGAVTLIQRFGGSLNLNVHFHMLFLEGGYYPTAKELGQGPKFWWVEPPTDDDIKKMVALLAYRVIRYLKKKGYFQDDIESALPDEDSAQDELLPELQAASVQSKIAMGERRGQRVRRLGALEMKDLHPEMSGSLCAQVTGFSLHAAVYCKPWEREKLEKLCRYIARPAVAEERLELRASGDIVLRLKTKYSDGTSHLLFSGLEFVEKLAALVPPPRIHLTRFFGCLAPHAKIRSEIVPKKDPPEPTNCEATPDEPGDKKKPQKRSWAELLARTFGIDTLHCSCGGDLKLIAAIMEGSVIRKILIHLGLPENPPDIKPARLSPQMSF